MGLYPIGIGTHKQRKSCEISYRNKNYFFNLSPSTASFFYGENNPLNIVTVRIERHCLKKYVINQIAIVHKVKQTSTVSPLCNCCNTNSSFVHKTGPSHSSSMLTNSSNGLDVGIIRCKNACT